MRGLVAWCKPQQQQHRPRSGVDKMSRRVNGRAKGAAFERRIANDLRTWLSPEATGQIWTVMRAQTDRQRGQDPDHAGEFVIECPTDRRQRFPWSIECKSEKAWHEAQLWSTPVTGPITSTEKRRGYWQQTVEQASSVGLAPVLIVKRNHGPVLAIMERKTWQALGLYRLPLLRFDLDLHGERWLLCAVPWAMLLEAHPANLMRKL